MISYCNLEKLLFILISCFLICSCQQKELEEYNEQEYIQADTLNIERIKIPTH